MSNYPFTLADINFVPAGVRLPESRYVEGSTEAVKNYEPEIRSVRIANGRVEQDLFNLDTHGFELVPHSTALGAVEDAAHPDIAEIYEPEIDRLLKAATGADDVLIFDHTIRIAGNRNGRRPVFQAHNDYTETSAPQRVAQLIGDKDAARRFDGRVAQVNVWRPLKGPVQALPLAVADARTVDPHDLRKSALVYPGRVGETYHLTYSPRQRWTYFPEMTTDEVLLLKGYDSATDGRSRFTPHTAFEHPETRADAPARHSIETRTFLFFNA